MASGESSVQDPDATDQLVLEDPDAFTVDEVVEVFARSTPEQMSDTKHLESEGRGRVGIMSWEPPAPDTSTASAEPFFTRERLLGRDGERIAGYPHVVIAGAIHGDAEDCEYTRSAIAEQCEAFLARPVEEA